MKRSIFIRVHSAELRSGMRLFNKVTKMTEQMEPAIQCAAMFNVIMKITRHWKKIKAAR